VAALAAWPLGPVGPRIGTATGTGRLASEQAGVEILASRWARQSNRNTAGCLVPDPGIPGGTALVTGCADGPGPAVKQRPPDRLVNEPRRAQAGPAAGGSDSAPGAGDRFSRSSSMSRLSGSSPGWSGGGVDSGMR
jgi:hypothetical protein